MIDKATTYFRKIQLKNKQRHIDKTLAKQGLTDELLLEQVELNRLRNKYNISDESTKTYEDYVQ